MTILSASKSPTCLGTSPHLTNRQSSNIRSNPIRAKTFHDNVSFCESQALTEATTPATQMTSHGNAGGFFRRSNFIVNTLRSAISTCNLCKGTRDVGDEIRQIRDEILASQNRLENCILARLEARLELFDSRLAHLEIRIHGLYTRQLQIIYNIIIFVSQSLSFHVSSNTISALEVQNEEKLRAELTLRSEPVPEMYDDNDGKCK
jgi:hypothetical protein